MIGTNDSWVNKTLFLKSVTGEQIAETQNKMNASSNCKVNATQIFLKTYDATLDENIYDVFIYYTKKEVVKKSLDLGVLK